MDAYEKWLYESIKIADENYQQSLERSRRYPNTVKPDFYWGRLAALTEARNKYQALRESETHDDIP